MDTRISSALFVLAVASSASIAHAGPDIKQTLDDIANNVAKAEGDVCKFLNEHDKIFFVAFADLVYSWKDGAKQVKIFVDLNCKQDDVLNVVNNPNLVEMLK
jgi:hypothetical protein